MKTEPLYYALIGGGLVAAAWALSSVRLPIGIESVLGYAVVAGIVAMLVSEYRLPAKKLIGK